MVEKVTIGNATLYCGDCREVLAGMADCSVDSIVCDPPYELGFMGKGWDITGIANDATMWAACLRVLKPGGHLLAFSGSRTYHRMTCAIEDAGFEIRDQIMWVYGSGFPKSLDVSKAIDKAAGVEREVTGEMLKCGLATAAENYQGNEKWSGKRRDTPATHAAKQWQGWGTALKPAHEPICVARKPLIGTVADNVLTHGTGAINVDGCRVANNGEKISAGFSKSKKNGVNNANAGWKRPWQENREYYSNKIEDAIERTNTLGRFPANFIHDGIEEEWARYFYCAKASKKDRDEGLDGVVAGVVAGVGALRDGGRESEPRANVHPTVKPTDLMRYLCRLVTPPNGVVLDHFMGSGSTGKAAMREGFGFIGIDMTEDYFKIACKRIEDAQRQGNLF